MNINEIETIIKTIKENHPNIIIFVDNCYGEFAETREPLEAGADMIIVGNALEKNPKLLTEIADKIYEWNHRVGKN